MQNEITDEQFLSICNMLGIKYGLTVGVDFETRTVNFEGDGDEVACAQEMSDILGKYAM